MEEVLRIWMNDARNALKTVGGDYSFVQIKDGSDEFPIELLVSKLNKLGYIVNVQISQFDFWVMIDW